MITIFSSFMKVYLLGYGVVPTKVKKHISSSFFFKHKMTNEDLCNKEEMIKFSRH